MNNSKRNLKIVSIIILAMALVSLVWGIYGLVTLDTSAVEVPEGMTKEVVHVITMITGAFALLLILPRIYIGVVGLQGGKDGSRAHIIVAIIFGVLSLVGLISAITSFNGAALGKSLVGLIEAIIVTAVYALYIKFARDVAKK
jgi:type IV secretory pathway VirB2 component (pilin)